jgi:hypothetical protein
MLSSALIAISINDDQHLDELGRPTGTHTVEEAKHSLGKNR